MMERNKIIISIILLLILASCKPDKVAHTYVLEIPKGFPAPSIPDNNQLTQKRIDLGKRLFYDKNLSLDSTVSCGTCHLQSAAFSDHKSISSGIKGRLGKRNVPTLTNMVYNPYFFAEGGSPMLEAQSLGPIGEEAEMGMNVRDLVEKIAQSGDYQQDAQDAYGRNFDAWVLTRALASFERTLISGNSAYDRYTFHNERDAMSSEAIRGMKLFFSEKLACRKCHDGTNFTNYKFENIGLYEEYADVGRYRLSNDSSDIGKFKIPTLRNIEMTAPYMHDGSIATLEEVVEYFNGGGAEHLNQNEWVKPLHLNETEKADLVEFLKSLTDHDFLNDPKFR